MVFSSWYCQSCFGNILLIWEERICLCYIRFCHSEQCGNTDSKYWVGQWIRSGFSFRCYGKTQTKALVHMVEENMLKSWNTGLLPPFIVYNHLRVFWFPLLNPICKMGAWNCAVSEVCGCSRSPHSTVLRSVRWSNPVCSLWDRGTVVSLQGPSPQLSALGFVSSPFLCLPPLLLFLRSSP